MLALIMGACASPPSTVKKYDFQSAVAAFKRSTIPAGKPVIRQQSRVSAFESKDEMQGTATYYIYIKAEDYREYINEDQLKLVCEPNGRSWMMFHWGGQHSGGWHDPARTTVQLKFDDEPTLVATYTYFNDRALMRWFLAKVKAHERLFIKSGAYSSVTRFNLGLPAWTEALAVIRKFERQCLTDSGPRPSSAASR